MTEELIRKRKLRDGMEEFIRGPLHEGFVAAREREVCRLKEQVLDLDPVRREDEIEQFKLRGEIRCMERMIGIFPAALEELKDRIDELESEEVDARPHSRDRYEDLLT